MLNEQNRDGDCSELRSQVPHRLAEEKDSITIAGDEESRLSKV